MLFTTIAFPMYIIQSMYTACVVVHACDTDDDMNTEDGPGFFADQKRLGGATASAVHALSNICGFWLLLRLPAACYMRRRFSLLLAPAASEH